MEQEPESQELETPKLRINTPSMAFPSDVSKGMTMMDYFAGQALAGYLAHNGYPDDIKKAAYAIWRMADALMESRPPNPPSPPSVRRQFRSL